MQGVLDVGVVEDLSPTHYVDGELGSHALLEVKEELLTKVHVVQVLHQGVECEVLQEDHDV